MTGRGRKAAVALSVAGAAIVTYRGLAGHHPK